MSLIQETAELHAYVDIRFFSKSTSLRKRTLGLNPNSSFLNYSFSLISRHIGKFFQIQNRPNSPKLRQGLFLNNSAQKSPGAHCRQTRPSARHISTTRLRSSTTNRILLLSSVWTSSRF